MNACRTLLADKGYSHEHILTKALIINSFDFIYLILIQFISFI